MSETSSHSLVQVDASVDMAEIFAGADGQNDSWHPPNEPQSVRQQQRAKSISICALDIWKEKTNVL